MQWPKENRKKDKQRDKRTNHDLQDIPQNTKDSSTRTPQKLGVNSGAPEWLAVLASHVTPIVLLLIHTM